MTTNKAKDSKNTTSKLESLLRTTKSVGNEVHRSPALVNKVHRSPALGNEVHRSPALVNVKKAHLNKHGYANVKEWMLDTNHVYIGRKMRIFIHNKVEALEPPGTKTMMAGETRFIYTPVIYEDGVGHKDGKSIMDFPQGSYVDKKGFIVEFYQLPESPWHNPFRIVPGGHNTFRLNGKEGPSGHGNGNGNGNEKDGRENVVNDYQEYLLKSPLMDRLGELKGKTLGCWCTPKACHGDVIIAAYEKKITRRP